MNIYLFTVQHGEWENLLGGCLLTKKLNRKKYPMALRNRIITYILRRIMTSKKPV